MTPEKGPPNAPPTSPNAGSSQPIPIPVSVESITSPTVELPPVVPNGVGPGMKSVDPAQLQSIEESISQQTLFTPVKVDTSMVQGKITQVSHAHHSTTE